MYLYFPPFKMDFIKRCKEYPNIKLKAFHICVMEHLSMFKHGTFDYVIATHVLCSVSDQVSSINQVYNVLKKVLNKQVLTPHYTQQLVLIVSVVKLN